MYTIMSLPRIFKSEQQDIPVSTLIQGSYVLGRGPMLKCFDKRVSRNHATLLVGDQNVTLTSTHINPCFHRALGGKGITIIPKDQTKVLQDGDKFALLADQFWYEIKVTINNEDKSPQLTQNPPCDPTSTHTVALGNETIYVTNVDSPNRASGNKPDEKEEDEEVAVHCSQQNGKNVKPADTTAVSPIKVAQKNDDIENVAGPSKVTLHDNVAIDASQSLLCSNAINSSVVNSESIVISSDENRVNQKRNPVDDVSPSPQKRQKLCPKSADESKCADENMEVSVNKDDDDDVKEGANMGDSADEDLELSLCLVGSSEDNKNEEAQIEEHIQEDVEAQSRQAEDENRMETSPSKPDKTEGGDKSREELEECAQNEDVDKGDSSSTKEASKDESKDQEQEQLHKEEQSAEYAQNENVDEEVRSPAEDPNTNRSGQNDTSDAPDASAAAGPSTGAPRRDRCWYGTTCYRKDPNHKMHFSHPGDDDYDSDPKDDRPTCAYGAACYRRNLNHRQRYKHPGPPAPNPNNTNAINGRPRRRAAATNVNYNDNNTPIDDYDYSDPFIDDGSSDEYRGSDASDSDTDTEFTPSQDSEDITALIKDAKKFTKR